MNSSIGKCLFLFGLCFVPLLVQAQYLVKGTLYDSKTKEVLSYAPIVPLPSQKGSLTNGEGYFELRSNAPVKELKATYMGYQPQTVSVPDPTKKEQTVDVFLVPLPIMLQEVVVSAKGREPEELIKALYESLKSKASEHHCAEGLLRSYYTSNDVPYLATEDFYMMDVNQSGVGECKFLQGRVAQSKYSYENISRVFWYLPSRTYRIRVEAVVTDFVPPSVLLKELQFWRNISSFVYPISAQPAFFYDYTKAGVYSLNDETVTIIKFQSRKGLEPVVSGKLEFIEDKMQIVSLEVDMVAKESEYNHKIRWEYSKSDGVWRLEKINYVKTQINNRNNPSLSNVPTVAHYDLLLYKHNVTSDEYQKISPETKDTGVGWGIGNEPIDNIQNIRKAVYDSTFWQKQQQLLAEIPFEQSVQKAMTSGGFYGNLFPGGITIPTMKIPGCSDLQNTVMERVVEFYRFSLFCFMGHQNEVSETKITDFFKKEVQPLCRDYIYKVARGEVSDVLMQKTLNLMAKVSSTSDIVSILRSFDKERGLSLKRLMDKTFWISDQSFYTPQESILY